MKEANPVKYYLANYFFLAVAILQWIAATVVITKQPDSGRNLAIGFAFTTLGLISFTVFIMVSEKIKRVAIGKNKIVIVGHKKKYCWSDVRSLELVPWLNLYRLKIKGKKGNIYFFPDGQTETAYGILTADASPTGELIEKRMKN